MYQLIGSPVSLYTAKLRAYLRYKAIPFSECLSTGEVYKKIILPNTGVAFIPVLKTPEGHYLQDTTDIIDHLEALFTQNNIFPSTPKQRLVAHLLEAYGDEWLVNPAMLYRWRIEENKAFALREFGKTSAPNLTPAEQFTIGQKNAGPFAGALPYLGITDKSAGAIQTSYLQLLEDLNKHFQEHEFLLGSRPSIADFSFFGPLYGHLYRDPASGRLMQEHAPNLCAWIDRLLTPYPLCGKFLDNDEVPNTLHPILQRLQLELLPVIQQTFKEVSQWVSDNGEGEIPRSISTLSYKIGEVEEKRHVFPFNLWKWQRVNDHIQTLHEESRNSLGQLINLKACELPIQTPEFRLARVNNILMVKWV